MQERTGPTTPAVKVMCPNLSCRRILSIPAEARGQTVKCQHCQTLLRVPPGKAATAA